jgi:hypothetical protein
MKFFKNIFLISLLSIVFGTAYATTYYTYGGGFTGGAVSGLLGPYITGDLFIPRSDGSDCSCTSLYHANIGYYPLHTQPSLDYVSGFSETFSGRCNTNVHLNTELAGQVSGFYALAHPCGYSGRNSGTPSYCIISWNGTTADVSNCGHLSATVSITAPTNASTQTDKTVLVSGTWIAVDPAIYADIRLYFKHTGNGVDTVSTGQIVPVTSSSGSFSIPLSAFDFDFNGDWVLTSVADLKAPQLSDFIQTSNIIDPSGYHLNINFSTLTTLFTFSDWSTWYGTNAAGGYTAPSDFGNAFVGFFTPIFENAFRFANAVLQYFDVGQAEAQGAKLGGALPIADAYVSKLDVFFGGFPLMTLFKFTLIILLAIFVIRTVFKFIPFFG